MLSTQKVVVRAHYNSLLYYLALNVQLLCSIVSTYYLPTVHGAIRLTSLGWVCVYLYFPSVQKYTELYRPKWIIPFV